MCCFHLLDIVKVCAHVCLNTFFLGWILDWACCSPVFHLLQWVALVHILACAFLSTCPSILPNPGYLLLLVIQICPPATAVIPPAPPMFKLHCLFLCFKEGFCFGVEFRVSLGSPDWPQTHECEDGSVCHPPSSLSFTFVCALRVCPPHCHL